MKNYKSTILISLSILVVLGMLFGYVLQGQAQEDQNWTTPVNLSLSGIATNPILVVDSDNVLHSIWVDKVDGYQYSQSTDGVTWTKSKTVRYPFDKNSAPPVLLSDANGSIHTFWIDSKKGLYYVRATPLNISNPAQWQSATTRLATNVVNFDVILDSQGSIHIAYINTVSSEISPAGVYYRQLLISGGAWTNEAMLYTSDYFRSSTESDTFVRIATSNTFSNQKVYVVWDSRPQKRVFMAVSSDSGLTWNEAQQIKDVEDTGVIDIPYNLNVAAANDKVLIMWQAGQPGTAKCDVLSQWSEDNGRSWGDVISVLEGRSNCPVSSKFIVQDDDYVVTLLTGQIDPTLVAWNGEQWSDPQTQTQLPAFSNPFTYDAILLGCRFDLIHQNRLYVVGCDQGGGGDVWFLSRSLEAVENWFSFPQTWGEPVVITGESGTISLLSSASDSQGVIHSIWANSFLSDESDLKAAIEYARWDGKRWTRPEAIISPLSGIPLQISITIDTEERLLLSWVDGGSGDLLFSWAKLDGANLATNWETPSGIPSPSNLISSPDIVADESGKIVVVYAIPLNEARGIYLVQSTDNGKSWYAPVRVFDAASARWEKIGNPKISLSADGMLHLIFNRDHVRTGQPTGLYYSNSKDGGTTWSDPQFLSEGNIQWSNIVSYDNRTVHVLWQEYDGLVFANLSQVSEDGGESWSRTFNITGVNDNPTSVALADDGFGNLHFVQLLKNNNAPTIKQENLILQDWVWTDSNWEFASSTNLLIRGQEINYSLTADITPAGFLGVSMSAKYSDPDNKIHNEILTFNRFLGESTTSKDPIVALIPTPVIVTNATEIPDIQPSQPVDVSALYDDNVSTTTRLRNIIGILIIGVALVATVIFVVRGRNTNTEK